MTLTQAAILTKRGIIAFFILLFLGTTAKAGYDIWYSNYLASLPPVEEKAEMKFGVLPSLQFPPSTVSSSNFSYSLDTTTGDLPETPKLLKVYFIPQTNLSLLAPEKAKKLAESLGFKNGPEELSATQHRFTSGLGGSLTIDLSTGNFNYDKEKLLPSEMAVKKIDEKEATVSSELIRPVLNDKPKLVNDFKNYLGSKGLLPEELVGSRSNLTPQDPNSREPIIISLWPIDVDKVPVVNANFEHGLIQVTVSVSDVETVYQQLKYIYWPIDLTTYSTYPLKSASQAFSDLQAGKGFISLDPKTPQVSISSIYLAYYQTEQYSPYLQPVFVFEGPNFAALVEAMDYSQI